MSDQRRRPGTASLCFVALALLGVGSAYAQEAIQEVVVTAQKRVENLQTIPIAISAMTSDDMQKRGVTDFTGIANSSTSINYTPYPSSSQTLILYMRGQGVADPNQITQDGSVGLYEDGFYISRPQQATFDLADVERVEVLRGPQGTLYGRNTTGGAVNIVSQKPTGELDAKGQLTFGSRGDLRALATVNLPSFNGLAVKLTGVASSIDGYVRNPGPSEDFGIERQQAGRISLHWDQGGPFNVDYFFEHGEIDSTPIFYEDPALNGVLAGYSSYGQPSSTAWRPFNEPLSKGRNEGQGLTLSLNINDSTTLRSLTGYRTLYSHTYQDYGDAFSDPATAAFIGRTQFTSEDIINSHQFSQEFQLVGDVGKQFNYVFGLYYFKEGGNHEEIGGIAIPGLPYAYSNPAFAAVPLSLTFDQLTLRYVTADAKSEAAFAQGTWKPPGFDDKLAVTIGARYTKDTRDATRDDSNYLVGLAAPPGLLVAQELGAHNSQSFSKFNPAGTINYTWTPDLDTYLRIATGYKAGGSSESGPPGAFGITYGPETLTQYEIGIKSYWLDRRIRINAAAFHSDIKDLQLAFDTDPSNLGIVLSQNAGSATIDGLELETLFQPTNDLSIAIDYSYLDPKLKVVNALAGTVLDPAVNPASPYHVGQNVASLFQLPYAPRNTFNINADWTFLHAGSNALALQLNYRYQDRQFDTTTTGPAVPNAEKFYSIPGHGLLDARVTWTDDLSNHKRLKASIWAKNVTDEKYLQHVIGQGPFLPIPNAAYPGGVQPGGYTFQALAWAPKPLYGIDLSYGF